VEHCSLSDSDSPALILRTHFRGRKFLEEIQNVALTAEMVCIFCHRIELFSQFNAQIGTIRLPFYMKPDDADHKTQPSHQFSTPQFLSLSEFWPIGTIVTR
jgi:hypothetical protein